MNINPKDFAYLQIIENDLAGNASSRIPYDYSKVPIYERSYIFNIAAWAVRIWFTNPGILIGLLTPLYNNCTYTPPINSNPPCFA